MEVTCVPVHLVRDQLIRAKSLLQSFCAKKEQLKLYFESQPLRQNSLRIIYTFRLVFEHTSYNRICSVFLYALQQDLLCFSLLCMTRFVLFSLPVYERISSVFSNCQQLNVFCLTQLSSVLSVCLVLFLYVYDRLCYYTTIRNKYFYCLL